MGIITQEAEILLIRKKSGPNAGLWGLPGEEIKFGESPEHAVIRALQEEAALIARQVELFDTFTSNVEESPSCALHHIGIIYKVVAWDKAGYLIPEESKRWFNLYNTHAKELTPCAHYALLKLVNSTSWRPMNHIRGKVVGLALHEHCLLVFEVLDDRGSVKGWCPLGGGIEFGESAEQALRREIKEELGSEIELLGSSLVCENIFQHQGVTGHEVVFAFPIIFNNPEIYAQKRWQIFEQRGSSHWVEWIDIELFRSGRATFFPQAILDRWMGSHTQMHSRN